MPFLSDYPDSTSANKTATGRLSQNPLRVSLLIVLALFVYQASQMAPYVYIFELGQSYSLSDSFLGWANGVAIWTGGIAAVITAYWSTRSGYVLPMIVGGLLSALSVALLAYPSAVTYFVACVGFTFFFTITVVYMLALFSVLDSSGRFATIGSFINTLGLASGPLIAATLLSVGYNYVNLAWIGALGMMISCVVVLAPGRYVERYEQ